MSLETTALCLTCGSEEEVEDLKDGLCRICRTYPEDFYEWHLAVCFRGGDPTSDEADAFLGQAGSKGSLPDSSA